MRNLKRFAVSVGYPLGVGPEVIAKAVAQAPTAEWVLFGDRAIIGRALKRWARAGRSGVVVEDGRGAFDAGGDPLAAQEAAVIAAANAVLRGDCAALVTGPMLRVPGAVGHTEILARHCRVREVAMAFEADWLRLALVTIHLPLRLVPRRLTPARIASVARLFATYLEAAGHQRGARLALAGLNPHNDAGPAGHRNAVRETRLLSEAVRLAHAAGVDLSDPVPADALFGSRARGYHGVVALYHDQGLIPAKLVAGHAALNITLGLPFARVAPAHGVALDIAGRGIADARGMVAAMSYVPVLAERWPWARR